MAEEDVCVGGKYLHKVFCGCSQAGGGVQLKGDSRTGDKTLLSQGWSERDSDGWKDIHGITSDCCDMV